MTDAAFNIGFPLFHKVEFHPDRRKAAAVGLAAVIAGGLIAFPAAARQAPTQGFPEILAAAVALTGAVMLVGVGLFILFRQLLWRGAVVVIDSQGIHDRRTGDAVVPWSAIRDIRVLDRHGSHIGIETHATADDPGDRQGWMRPRPRRFRTRRLTVVDTFFLQSRTGDRVLDFIMPLTAMAPIDVSEIPVSDATLSADARLARFRNSAVLLFILAAGIIPAIAATTLLFM